MEFKGLIEDALGYLVIRGFAKIDDLKKYSISKNYQRFTLDKHISEIKQFYKDGENLYFPEIILSLESNFYPKSKLDKKLNLQNNIKNSFDSNVNNIEKIIDKIDFVSNIKNIEIKLTIKNGIANIIFNDNENNIFGRIDGNHRLEAFDTHTHLQKKVPFCIILFEPDKIQKQEKTLFHNINSKVVPLKIEEVLSSIILDKENFNDEYLSSEFGKSYLFSRKRIDEINIELVAPIIAEQLESIKISAFVKIFELLEKYKPKTNLETFIEIIRKVEFIYRKNKALNSKINSSVCTVFIFYAIYNPDKLGQLENWILKNYFHEITEIEPETIINILENLTKHRKLKIFVAMPYWSHAVVNEYNKLFKEALKEIEQEKDIFYELFPIMRHRGASQRIDQRLLNQIKECDIFVADLTGINQNVLYEVGYAEGLDKPSLLLRTEEDDKEKQLPFDMAQRQYIPYPKGAYYSNIKAILKNNLPTIIDDYQLKKLKLLD